MDCEKLNLKAIFFSPNATATIYSSKTTQGFFNKDEAYFHTIWTILESIDFKHHLLKTIIF